MGRQLRGAEGGVQAAAQYEPQRPQAGGADACPLQPPPLTAAAEAGAAVAEAADEEAAGKQPAECVPASPWYFQPAAFGI